MAFPSAAAKCSASSPEADEPINGEESVMTRNRTIAAGTAVLLALALAAYAVAAQKADPVASYAGCLKNGKIESVAVGDTPLAPCGPGQTQVRLGGGDITSVNARPGLLGGGTNGDLQLGIDPTVVQSRVTGDCRGLPLLPLDASISAVDEDGSVTCNTDDDSSAVIAGFADGPVDLPIGTLFQRVAELPLPQGKYAIFAMLEIRAGGSTGSYLANCRLRAGADFDDAQFDVAGFLVPNTTHVGRMSLNVVHDFAEAGAAVLSCTTPTGGEWRFLKITAIRVASLSNSPLTLP
jgi:hypothetical protein